MSTPLPPGTAPLEKIKPALTGYRVLAWATGLWLIALCIEMVAKYGYGVENLNWIALVHGWMYFAYLLAALNLAVKVRWPWPKTLGILLAGTIPFLGIVLDQK